jgi:hypothetical protein
MAARSAAEKSVNTLGLAALSTHNVFQRDALLGAQFELNRKLAIFALTFNDTLDRRVARDMAPLLGQGLPAPTDWDALSLVDNQEVENQVSAERFALEIQHQCEWELRDLDAFMGAVLGLGQAESARNPLRPELVGLALMRAVDAVVTDRPDSRKVLATEVGRCLAGTMKQTYQDIAGDLRGAGVQPAQLAVRPQRSGHTGGRSTSGADTLGAPSSGRGAADPAAATATVAAAPSAARVGSGAARAGRPLGSVAPALAGLIRELAAGGGLPLAAGAGEPACPGDGGWASASVPAGYVTTGGGGEPAPNLILAHRDQLRQMASAPLDHMVIDVVGSLFEQILSDPKVPPQMARQIARLQLPVLRAALGDPSFFSSRKHPVRRFVNRIASLACAYDDFEQPDGRAFLSLVKDLVHQIAAGDFDHMEVYEAQLAQLEAFVSEQAQREAQAQGNAGELLARKETELRVQQAHAQTLHAALAPVPVDDFLREFVAHTWSLVVARAEVAAGEPLAERFRIAGRELVMSVQPKGSPAARKAFLMGLPQLMKNLNAGMDLIRLPEVQRKAFFSKLLPAHADSLKGAPLRTLDHNMMVRQVEQILATPRPSAAELPAPQPAAVADSQVHAAFSEEEAQAVGLIDEASVNWNGTVDIEVGADEPELTEVDIQIDGLPQAEAVEPSRGRSLADHVQIGFAYQMHLDDGWHKVRLVHMSQGRSFFVFTRGGKHKRTIAMTYRMLARLCDSGRLRAFENGYLLERATARTRRQLARIMPATSQAQALV